MVGVVSEADLLHKEEFHEDGPGTTEQMQRLRDTAKAGSVSAKDFREWSRSAAAVRDSALIPVAARLAHAVEGVVGVTCDVTDRSTGEHRSVGVLRGCAS
ncbi:hypothetical protein OG883_13470 [Streptomyces sp. NBC_01142]|uniref:hypothetical protein n=1 Tax=Streptomyces sp. NBC_01142 TaxID=2975865 RepID=UPI00224D2914|nr:hypothetical protein [Streptomyces sp. NBC_01142]MCX4820899.1 hypothetical protein [Streptomyces sp. NBC_01142]